MSSPNELLLQVMLFGEDSSCDGEDVGMVVDARGCSCSQQAPRDAQASLGAPLPPE